VAAFWVSAGVFHGLLGAFTVWLACRWRRRLAGPRRPGWLWLIQLAADGILLSWAAFLIGASAAVWAPHPAFTLARFLTQAAFLEAPCLAVVVAVMHRRHREPTRALLPLAAALLLGAAYAYAYHWEPRQLVVRRYPLGQGETVLRIAHLSDLQTHRIGAHERRALLAARALQPDLVAFTGDYLQPRLDGDLTGATRDLRRLLAELDLRPRYGFYAVAGDVEDPVHWRELFAGLPVECLDDESRTLPLADGRRLTVIGLANATSRGRDPATLAAVLDRAPPGDLRLLLAHRPDCIAALPGTAGVDLLLAGHTHGGQVVVPFFGPPITLSRLPRRHAAGGLTRYGPTWLHVSRGIGMERLTAPQIRFFCPPEISLIELRAGR
jgi:predicted MPP superfamily phosphohydrolase